MSRTKPIALKAVSSTHVQQHFGSVIRQVYKDKARFLIERNGLPIMVILPVGDYEALVRKDGNA